MLIRVKLLRSANAARDICKSRPRLDAEKLSASTRKPVSRSTSVLPFRSEREISDASEDSYRESRLEAILGEARGAERDTPSGPENSRRFEIAPLDREGKKQREDISPMSDASRIYPY